MMHLSKSVLVASGAVVAAGLIGLMSPKTVHAVAAALVEVTNTAANPAVTQSITQQATQTVRLRCSPSGSATDCVVTPPLGQNGAAAYVVPPNQSLIVTAMDVTFPNCQEQVGPIILTDSVDDTTAIGSIRWEWGLPISAANYNGETLTNHLTFPPGAGPLIHSGDTVRVASLACSDAVIDAYGYLTAN